jgi:hypothetical protein
MVIPDSIKNLLFDGDKLSPAKVATAGGLGALLYGTLNKDSKIGEFINGKPQRPVGYTGGIPEYEIGRSLAPNAFSTTTPTGEPRRPGSAGRRYFTDTAFTPTGKIMGPTTSPVAANPSSGIFGSLTPEAAQSMLIGMFGGSSGVATPTAVPAPKYTNAQVKGTLDTLIAQNPNRGEGLYRAVGEQIKSEIGKGGVTLESAAKQLASLMPEFSEQEIIAKYRQMGFAQGGLASLPQSKGYYLGGSTDGMADEIPASINGEQAAALSDGEFVVPADVVSGLGNGNSDAGAKVLYSMLDRVRQARTGTTEQGRKIAPNKFTPV